MHGGKCTTFFRIPGVLHLHFKCIQENPSLIFKYLQSIRNRKIIEKRFLSESWVKYFINEHNHVSPVISDVAQLIEFLNGSNIYPGRPVIDDIYQIADISMGRALGNTQLSKVLLIWSFRSLRSTTI